MGGIARYGSTDSEAMPHTSQGPEASTDISDIKSYFKHRTKFRWQNIVDVLWELKWLILVVLALEIILVLVGIFNSQWRAMSWEAWASIEITVVTLFFLVANFLPPAFIFLAAMSACYALGIIDSEQALEGFSNSGVITVGILFVVAKGIENSNVLRYMTKYILRSPKTLLSAQIRLLIPVAFLSAFINNTPIVAMMIPVVQNWSRQCGLKVTKFLMPMSFAAILGGTCTIIGTSTNLIVQGLALQEDPTMDIGFFEIGWVGVPVCIVSMVYMFITSRFLLPSADPDDIEAGPTLAEGVKGEPSQRRLYTCSLVITKGSNLVGQSVEDAGLNKLPGLTLFSVRRMQEKAPAPVHIEEFVSPVEGDGSIQGSEEGSQVHSVVDSNTELEEVDPDLLLHAGDTLFWSGKLRHMYILYQLDGLVPATTQVAKIQGARHNRIIVEVVLSPYASYIGETVRDSHFRTRYNAVIIAANRYGVRLSSKIGDIVLQAGDTLLLEATTDFLRYHRDDSDFALVSEILRGESTTPRRLSFRMILAVTLATVMVILSATQVFDLLPGALLVACLYVACKILTWQQATSSVQGDTLLIIAAAFGLGNALQESGAADVISNTLVNVFSLAGDLGVLAGLYATTALLSAVISNAATVTLMYPIAVGFAYTMGIGLKCVTFILMLAASCSFSTPVGYQTNLMVMGPGGYSTMDFLKFGVPLTIIDLVISVLLSYYIWGDDLQPSRENYYDEG